MKNFDYNKFVANKHSKFNTPLEILEKVVLKATNHKIVRTNKLLKGEANEVYDITLDNDTNVIVRISREKLNPFYKEEWAMNKCRDLGVPVAKVIHIDEAGNENEKLYLCVLSKIDGIPLNELDYANIPGDSKMHSLMNQMGHYLSLIHSVQTIGFHHVIDGSGNCEYPTYQSYIDAEIKQADKFKDAAEQNGLKFEQILNALDIIKNNLIIFDGKSPVLAHGDTGTKHIMVKNNKITGILDFGNIRGCFPLHDFAWWDFWRDNPEQLSWLREGYDNKAVFGDKYNIEFYMLKLILSLELLHWTNFERHMNGVNHAIHSIKSSIAMLKKS